MADIKSVLDAVGTALGVIKSATNLPGVNLIPYVSTVSSFVDLAQVALGQEQNIESLVTSFTDTFAGGLPAQATLDALDARIAVARAKVHAPLPAKEDGEPD